jgi:hypothetical protein
MQDSAKILKFLTTIRDLRASATHSRVAYKVWGGRRGIVAWNLLFKDPEMSGMVITARYQKRGRKGKMRCGRPSLRYALTRAGRKLMRDLLKAQAIAQETARMAAQDAKEATQRARQDEVERETQAKVQAAINARPKYPSKGRKRSQRDIEARLAWRRKTYLNEQIEPAALAVPRPPRETITTPAPEPARPIAPAQDNDWRRYINTPARPVGFEPTIQAPLTDSKSSALVSRIARAGYQTRGGKVLYSGVWILPEEWRAKMPHVEL